MFGSAVTISTGERERARVARADLHMAPGEPASASEPGHTSSQCPQGTGCCMDCAYLSAYLPERHERLLPSAVPRNDLRAQARARCRARLRLAQARAEESIVRAHVDNALMFVDTLAEDLSFDRAIDTTSARCPSPSRSRAPSRRARSVVLGQDLVPYRRRAQESDESERPKLHGRGVRGPRAHHQESLRPRCVSGRNKAPHARSS